MIKAKIMKSGFVLIVMAVFIGAATCASGVESTADVLVVPARHTIIQLAFDIAALRNVALIAYDKPAPETEEPLLHVWSSSNHAWVHLTLDEYNVGTFCDQEPNEMILIGNDSDLPASLIAGAAQAMTVTHIDTLSLVTVINTLDKSMKFSPREWKVLAQRHNLTIKDQNYERRRWGRYGPPKDEKTESDESDVLDPEALVEVNCRVAEQELQQEFSENATPAEAEGGLELAPETAAEITEAIAVEPVEVEIPALEKGAPVEAMGTKDSSIDSTLDIVAPEVEADTAAEDK